jgi:hypothetical protein
MFLPARVLASVAAAGVLCVLPTPVTFCMAPQTFLSCCPVPLQRFSRVDHDADAHAKSQRTMSSAATTAIAKNTYRTLHIFGSRLKSAQGAAAGCPYALPEQFWCYAYSMLEANSVPNSAVGSSWPHMPAGETIRRPLGPCPAGMRSPLAVPSPTTSSRWPAGHAGQTKERLLARPWHCLRLDWLSVPPTSSKAAPRAQHLAAHTASCQGPQLLTGPLSDDDELETAAALNT